MVPHDDPVPSNALLRLVSFVLMLLGAPARAWTRFVRWSDKKLEVLERTLEILYRRGYRLRYEGESEETAERRLRLVEWFMANPRKAQRHLGRLHRAGYRIFFRPGNALQHASPAGAPVHDAFVDELFAPECVCDDSS